MRDGPDERCYGAQAILECDLGAVPEPSVEQVKILVRLGSSAYRHRPVGNKIPLKEKSTHP